MAPESYSVSALCLVLDEPVLMPGLRLPKCLLICYGDADGLAMIISPVLGPYLRINAHWYQEFLFKGCLRLFIELYTHTLGGDSNTNVTHSDQNMLVFYLIFLLPSTDFSAHFFFVLF